MLHFFFFLILFLLPCSSCWVLGFWEASPLCVARIFRCQLRYSLLHLAVVHLKTTGKFCFVFEFHGHSGARWPLPVTTTKANNDWAISYVVSHCSKIDNRSTSPHPGLVFSFLGFLRPCQQLSLSISVSASGIASISVPPAHIVQLITIDILWFYKVTQMHASLYYGWNGYMVLVLYYYWLIIWNW